MNRASRKQASDRGRRGRRVGIHVAAALCVFAGATGCEGSNPLRAEGSPRVQIMLKDFPADIVASAEVWIPRVYLVGGGEGHVDLFHDPDDPRHYDLLTLRDGVTAELTEEVTVPAGAYGQLRLVVDSARVSLAEGHTFTDGSSSRTLFVPSGAQSGIKVLLQRDIEAEEGSTTIVLVDFDVEGSFVFQGAAQAGLMGVLFTPVLKEEGRSVEEG